MLDWPLEQVICKSDWEYGTRDILICCRYALAADIQTIPGLPTAPGYLNVDVDSETGEIDGLF